MAFVNFGKNRDAVSRPQNTQLLSALPVRSFTARYVKVVTSGRTPAALPRYKAQNFQARPPLACQRRCGDLVE